MSLPGSGDTIAAVATPPGRGGVAIVRVSGSQAAGIALAMFGRLPAPRVATRARFTDGSGTEIDDGLALLFRAPRSFTGEDVLELHGHGGAVVSRMVLDRVCELGARTARAGEFTLRAFLNDRIDWRRPRRSPISSTAHRPPRRGARAGRFRASSRAPSRATGMRSSSCARSSRRRSIFRRKRSISSEPPKPRRVSGRCVKQSPRRSPTPIAARCCATASSW